jgi:ParB-like chromosome segregation protein Spo0J
MRRREAVVDQTVNRLMHQANSAGGKVTEVVAVPIMSLRAGKSPRLNGEDKAHIARLAETELPLPPILVDRNTMQVIDGMHRLMAASLRAQQTIDVVFFDGSEADIFLRAVEENVAHGLPLTQSDRQAAAERIVATHPRMSDRAIGQATGLAAKTVATIRKRSTEESQRSNIRIGRDGRARPLDASNARWRAAELLTDQPEASLRDVARAAGISPATVLDVRKRIERGESPVPERPAQNFGAGTGAVHDIRPPVPPDAPPADVDPAATVEKLLRDPSLRNNERGKGMLRLLQSNAVGAEQLPDAATTVPPHCVAIVVQLASQYAQMWQEFARELESRARIIDPSAATRLTLAAR